MEINNIIEPFEYILKQTHLFNRYNSKPNIDPLVNTVEEVDLDDLSASLLAPPGAVAVPGAAAAVAPPETLDITDIDDIQQKFNFNPQDDKYKIYINNKENILFKEDDMDKLELECDKELTEYKEKYDKQYSKNMAFFDKIYNILNSPLTDKYKSIHNIQKTENAIDILNIYDLENYLKSSDYDIPDYKSDIYNKNIGSDLRLVDVKKFDKLQIYFDNYFKKISAQEIRQARFEEYYKKNPIYILFMTKYFELNDVGLLYDAAIKTLKSDILLLKLPNSFIKFYNNLYNIYNKDEINAQLLPNSNIATLTENIENIDAALVNPPNQPLVIPTYNNTFDTSSFDKYKEEFKTTYEEHYNSGIKTVEDNYNNYVATLNKINLNLDKYSRLNIKNEAITNIYDVAPLEFTNKMGAPGTNNLTDLITHNNTQLQVFQNLIQQQLFNNTLTTKTFDLINSFISKFKSYNELYQYYINLDDDILNNINNEPLTIYIKSFYNFYKIFNYLFQNNFEGLNNILQQLADNPATQFPFQLRRTNGIINGPVVINNEEAFLLFNIHNCIINNNIINNSIITTLNTAPSYYVGQLAGLDNLNSYNNLFDSNDLNSVNNNILGYIRNFINNIFNFHNRIEGFNYNAGAILNINLGGVNSNQLVNLIIDVSNHTNIYNFINFFYFRSIQNLPNNINPRNIIRDQKILDLDNNNLIITPDNYKILDIINNIPNNLLNYSGTLNWRVPQDLINFINMPEIGQTLIVGSSIYKLNVHINDPANRPVINDNLDNYMYSIGCLINIHYGWAYLNNNQNLLPNIKVHIIKQIILNIYYYYYNIKTLYNRLHNLPPNQINNWPTNLDSETNFKYYNIITSQNLKIIIPIVSPSKSYDLYNNNIATTINRNIANNFLISNDIAEIILNNEVGKTGAILRYINDYINQTIPADDNIKDIFSEFIKKIYINNFDYHDIITPQRGPPVSSKLQNIITHYFITRCEAVIPPADNFKSFNSKYLNYNNLLIATNNTITTKDLLINNSLVPLIAIKIMILLIAKNKTKPPQNIDPLKLSNFVNDIFDKFAKIDENLTKLNTDISAKYLPNISQLGAKFAELVGKIGANVQQANDNIENSAIADIIYTKYGIKDLDSISDIITAGNKLKEDLINPFKYKLIMECNLFLKYYELSELSTDVTTLKLSDIIKTILLTLIDNLSYIINYSDKPLNVPNYYRLLYKYIYKKYNDLKHYPNYNSEINNLLNNINSIFVEIINDSILLKDFNYKLINISHILYIYDKLFITFPNKAEYKIEDNNLMKAFFVVLYNETDPAIITHNLKHLKKLAYTDLTKIETLLGEANGISVSTGGASSVVDDILTDYKEKYPLEYNLLTTKYKDYPKYIRNDIVKEILLNENNPYILENFINNNISYNIQILYTLFDRNHYWYSSTNAAINKKYLEPADGTLINILNLDEKMRNFIENYTNIKRKNDILVLISHSFNKFKKIMNYFNIYIPNLENSKYVILIPTNDFTNLQIDEKDFINYVILSDKKPEKDNYFEEFYKQFDIVGFNDFNQKYRKIIDTISPYTFYTDFTLYKTFNDLPIEQEKNKFELNITGAKDIKSVAFNINLNYANSILTTTLFKSLNYNYDEIIKKFLYLYKSNNDNIVYKKLNKLYNVIKDNESVIINYINDEKAKELLIKKSVIKDNIINTIETYVGLLFPSLESDNGVNVSIDGTDGVDDGADSTDDSGKPIEILYLLKLNKPTETLYLPKFNGNKSHNFMNKVINYIKSDLDILDYVNLNGSQTGGRGSLMASRIPSPLKFDFSSFDLPTPPGSTKGGLLGSPSGATLTHGGLLGSPSGATLTHGGLLGSPSGFISSPMGSPAGMRILRKSSALSTEHNPFITDSPLLFQYSGHMNPSFQESAEEFAEELRGPQPYELSLLNDKTQKTILYKTIIKDILNTGDFTKFESNIELIVNVFRIKLVILMGESRKIYKPYNIYENEHLLDIIIQETVGEWEIVLTEDYINSITKPRVIFDEPLYKAAYKLYESLYDKPPQKSEEIKHWLMNKLQYAIEDIIIENTGITNEEYIKEELHKYIIKTAKLLNINYLYIQENELSIAILFKHIITKILISYKDFIPATIDKVKFNLITIQLLQNKNTYTMENLAELSIIELIIYIMNDLQIENYISYKKLPFKGFIKYIKDNETVLMKYSEDNQLNTLLEEFKDITGLYYTRDQVNGNYRGIFEKMIRQNDNNIMDQILASDKFRNLILYDLNGNKIINSPELIVQIATELLYSELIDTNMDEYPLYYLTTLYKKHNNTLPDNMLKAFILAEYYQVIYITYKNPDIIFYGKEDTFLVPYKLLLDIIHSTYSNKKIKDLLDIYDVAYYLFIDKIK